MFGMISTKDLHLIMMKPITRIEYGIDTTYHYGEENLYAYAYKKDDTTYIDCFTKTRYQRCDGIGIKTGDYAIIWAQPVVTEHKIIPISVLKETLEEINKESLGTIPKQKIK